VVKQNGIIRSNRNKFAVAYRAIDICVLQLALVVALYGYTLSYTLDYFIISLLGTLSFVFVAESFSLYRSWRTGFFNQIAFYTLLAWGALVISVLGFLFFSKTSVTYSRAALGIWFVLSLVILVSWRYYFGLFLRRMRRQGFNTRSVIIIGLTRDAARLADQILQHPETGYRLKAIYDDRSPDRLDAKYTSWLKGQVTDGISMARTNECDIVFLALPLHAEARLQHILNLLGDTTVDVQLVPNFFTYCLISASMAHVGEVQTISIYGNPMQGSSAVLKRLEDIFLSVTILTIISIPMLVIASAVKLTSKGPVFFTQNRYGLDGRKIKILKFRSMVVDDDHHKVMQATRDDPRVTRLGAFLRRTSLDELPQFFNVLKGEMSVVGPRPHAVEHNEEYRKQISHYMLRHKVKPGITGWAQVNGWRGETDTLEKMERRIDYDLDYIRNWSLFLDFKIVIYTMMRSFTDENAY